MKITLLAITSLLLIVTSSFARIETPVLIVSEKLCIILVDGTDKGTVRDGHPLLLNLSLGEHYLQAKTDAETVSQVVTCEDAKQKVVTIAFGKTAIPVNNPAITTEAAEIEIANLSLELPSMLADSYIEKFYCFDKGDKIKFSFNNTDVKGTSFIKIFSNADNQVIYTKDKTTQLTDAITVLQKGVYKFRFGTNNIFDRNASFKLARIPAINGNAQFNTAPTIHSDTSFIRLNDIKQTLVSRGFSNPIILPPLTTFWVYWVGIGEGASIKYDVKKEVYAEGKRGNEADLLYAYGVGAISSLPIYDNAKVVSYQFADNANSAKFLSGTQYNIYAFKSGSKTTTDYGKGPKYFKELNILITADNQIKETVYVKVGAFIVKNSYVVAE